MWLFIAWDQAHLLSSLRSPIFSPYSPLRSQLVPGKIVQACVSHLGIVIWEPMHGETIRGRWTVSLLHRSNPVGHWSWFHVQQKWKLAWRITLCGNRLKETQLDDDDVQSWRKIIGWVKIDFSGVMWVGIQEKRFAITGKQGGRISEKMAFVRLQEVVKMVNFVANMVKVAENIVIAESETPERYSKFLGKVVPPRLWNLPYPCSAAAWQPYRCILDVDSKTPYPIPDS